MPNDHKNCPFFSVFRQCLKDHAAHGIIVTLHLPSGICRAWEAAGSVMGERRFPLFFLEIRCKPLNPPSSCLHDRYRFLFAIGVQNVFGLLVKFYSNPVWLGVFGFGTSFFPSIQFYTPFKWECLNHNLGFPVCQVQKTLSGGDGEGQRSREALDRRAPSAPLAKGRFSHFWGNVGQSQAKGVGTLSMSFG